MQLDVIRLVFLILTAAKMKIWEFSSECWRQRQSWQNFIRRRKLWRKCK